MPASQNLSGGIWRLGWAGGKAGAGSDRCFAAPLQGCQTGEKKFRA